MNTKQFVNLMVLLFLCTPIDDSPIESWHSLLKKETLYNNDITSLENYIELVEEWIEFYNTTRIKGKKVNKKKGYKKNDK